MERLMCEACDEMEDYVDAIESIDLERKRIAEAIRQMQKANASNFVSGNELIDVVYNQQRQDETNIYRGWD
jgi:hypothetical protein